MSRKQNSNKTNSKPNNRRGNGKGNRPVNSKPSTKPEVEASPTNDPQWYAQNPAMLRDSASYPFNEAIGTKIQLDDYFQQSMTSEIAIPGVLTLIFKPTVGWSDVETSGLNTASRKLFATLRAYNNSGNPPYDHNDLMEVEIAIANAYAYVNMCARAYGMLNLFVYKNRYLPSAVFAAMNLDYDDFRDHAAQFRWDLDYMIASLASLWAPGNIPYFAQCSQMYSGYYVEGDDVKDQLYITVPYEFYQYHEADTTYPGGAVLPLKWYGQGSGTLGRHTRADLLNYFKQLTAPLMNNTDVNIISGDVRKAFGDNIIKIGEIPLNYQILPTADLTMLEKFKNANIIDQPIGNEIVPDPTQGFLISTPKCIGTGTVPNVASGQNVSKAYGSMVIGGKKLLTTIRTNPIDSDVMEMTRWTPMVDTASIVNIGSGGYKYEGHLLCGTYIPIAMQIFTMNPVNGNIDIDTFHNHLVVDGSVADTFWATLSNFKFHPEVRIFFDNGQVAGSAGSSYDIDNYTLVTSHDIDRMNDAALFSLFNA